MVRRRRKGKRNGKNHGILAYGTGIKIINRLGIDAALSQISQGADIGQAINFISTNMTATKMKNAMIDGIKLQVARKIVGPVTLFSTKKGSVSVFGR